MATYAFGERDGDPSDFAFRGEITASDDIGLAFDARM